MAGFQAAKRPNKSFSRPASTQRRKQPFLGSFELQNDRKKQLFSFCFGGGAAANTTGSFWRFPAANQPSSVFFRSAAARGAATRGFRLQNSRNKRLFSDRFHERRSNEINRFLEGPHCEATQKTAAIVPLPRGAATKTIWYCMLIL